MCMATKTMVETKREIMIIILIRIIIDNILSTWCKTDNIEMLYGMCKYNLHKGKC